MFVALMPRKFLSWNQRDDERSRVGLFYCFNTLWHKVLTYIYRVQSSVWRLPNYWPPTPSTPSECVLPPHQRRGGGGYTLAGRYRGGGSIVRKTPDFGLASYSIIPLRSLVYLPRGRMQIHILYIHSPGRNAWCKYMSPYQSAQHSLAAQLQILPRHPDEYLQGDHSFTVSFPLYIYAYVQ